MGLGGTEALGGLRPSQGKERANLWGLPVPQSKRSRDEATGLESWEQGAKRGLDRAVAIGAVPFPCTLVGLPQPAGLTGVLGSQIFF